MRAPVRGLVVVMLALLATTAAPATADARVRLKLTLPRAGDISVAHFDVNLRRTAPRRLPRPRLRQALPRGSTAVARVRRTGRRRVSLDIVTARRRASSGTAQTPAGSPSVFEWVWDLDDLAVSRARAANVVDKNRFPPRLGEAFRPPFTPFRRLAGSGGIAGLGAKELGETGLALAADFPSFEFGSVVNRLGGTYCYGPWTSFQNQNQYAGLTFECNTGASGFAINTPRHGITGFLPNNAPCTIESNRSLIRCNRAVQGGTHQQLLLQFNQPVDFGGDFAFLGSQGPGSAFTFFPTVPPIPPSQDPCDGIFWQVPGAPGAFQYRFDCENPVRSFTLTFGDGRRVGVRGFIPAAGFDCAPPRRDPRLLGQIQCNSPGQPQPIGSGRFIGPLGLNLRQVDLNVVAQDVSGTQLQFDLERR